MSNAGQTIWPIIALVIMLAAFAAILLWTYAGRKDRFEHDSRLPLEDDEPSVTNQHSARG